MSEFDRLTDEAVLSLVIARRSLGDEQGSERARTNLLSRISNLRRTLETAEQVRRGEIEAPLPCPECDGLWYHRPSCSDYHALDGAPSA